MTKRKSSAFLSRLAMGLIFVIAFIYAIYHLISLFTGDDVKTIVSGVTTHAETVGGSGYVFRDETLLSSDYSGAVDYFAADGTRVSQNQNIANVYAKKGDEVRQTVLALDRQIALLEKSSGGAEPLDLGKLRDEADDTYYRLSELLAKGEAGELSSQIETMMLTLNRISVMTDGEGRVTQSLETLKAARQKLLSGDYEPAYAPFSGYFYYSPDGYERLFSIEAADGLTEDSFYDLVDVLEGNKARLMENVFGKLSSDSYWKLVLPLDADDADKLSEGQVSTLIFPENNATRLPMTLEKKVDADAHGKVLCVFYCNRLPENFAFDRCQSVQVELTSASGIYVPRSALTKVDGVRGVYVLRGSVVHFRCVEIVYNGVDFCLVAENGANVGEYYALGNNELIITEGKNLFDGRILE